MPAAFPPLEACRLIGSVTITGMIFSSGIAIFLVPALYAVVERLSGRSAKSNSVERTTPAENGDDRANLGDARAAS